MDSPFDPQEGRRLVSSLPLQYWDRSGHVQNAKQHTWHWSPLGVLLGCWSFGLLLWLDLPNSQLFSSSYSALTIGRPMVPYFPQIPLDVRSSAALHAISELPMENAAATSTKRRKEASPGIPVRQRPNVGVDADLHTPLLQDDIQEVERLVAHHQVNLGLPAGDEKLTVALSEEEIETLWRFVAKPLLRLGASGISPSHLNLMADIVRARGVLKVKMAHHQVDLLDAAAIFIAQSPIPLRLLRAHRGQKVILLASLDAIDRIKANRFYPKKKTPPEGERDKAGGQ